jgi:hypothetical protein
MLGGRAGIPGARLPQLTGRGSTLARNVGIAGSRISASETPLRAAVESTQLGYVKFAESKAAEKLAIKNAFDEQVRRQQEAGVEPTPELLNAQKKAREDFDKWNKWTNEQRQLRKETRPTERNVEAISRTFTQLFARFEDKGAVPERPIALRARARNLRRQASRSDEPQTLIDEADYLDRKAEAKTNDTDNRFNDPDQKRDSFGAAVLVGSRIVDVVKDLLDEGRSIDDIVNIIIPDELPPSIRNQGYNITPGAVAKALAYVDGLADDVDNISVQEALLQLTGFSDFMTIQRQTGTGMVKGAASPLETGLLPLPEYIIIETGKPTTSGRVSRQVLMILDEAVAYVVQRYYPELITELNLDLDNLNGLFKAFANAPKDSPQYLVSGMAVYEAFPIIRADKNISKFLENPMIYPATSRPAMAARESGVRLSAGEDLRALSLELARFDENNPGLLPKNLFDRITGALEIAIDPNKPFATKNWRKVSDLVNSVIKEIQKQIKEIEEQRGTLAARADTNWARLEELAAAAQSAYGMIQTIIDQPELFADQAKVAEVARLRGVADTARLQQEALPSFKPDIELETKRQKAQKAADNAVKEKPEAKRALYSVVDEVSSVFVRLAGALGIDGKTLRTSAVVRDSFNRTMAAIYEDVANGVNPEQAARTHISKLDVIPEDVRNTMLERIKIEIETPADYSGPIQKPQLRKLTAEEFNPLVERPFRVRSEIEANTAELQAERAQLDADTQQVNRDIAETESRLQQAEALTPDDVTQLEADFNMASRVNEEYPYRVVDKTEVDSRVQEEINDRTEISRRLEQDFNSISKGPLLDRRSLSEDLASSIEQGLGTRANRKLYESFVRRWVAPKRASNPQTRRSGDPTPFRYDEIAPVIKEVYGLDDLVTAEGAWQELARRWELNNRVKQELADLRSPEARKRIAEGLQDEADAVIDSARADAYRELGLVDEYGFPRTVDDYKRLVDESKNTDVLRLRLDDLRRRSSTMAARMAQIEQAVAENASDVQRRLTEGETLRLRGEEARATQQAEGLLSANYETQVRGTRGMLRGVGKVKTPETINNAIAKINNQIDIFNERLNKVGAFGNFEQQLRQLVEGAKSGLLSLEYINDSNLASLLQSYGIDSIPKLEQLIDDAFDNPLSTKKLNDLLKQRNDLLQEQQSMPAGTKAGVLQAQFRQPLEADQARMVNEQIRNEAKTAALREQFANEDAALAEAQAIPGQATALSEQLAQPTGPRLFGEQRIPYIPAGVGRGVEQSFGVAKELVADAMAPETVGGFEKIRTGSMVPYTPGQYANRVDQILNQYTRNIVVQNFIRNQDFVTTVADKFTPEQLQALRDEATRRNPETFGADPAIVKRRIDAEYQNLLAQEIRSMGLEPISPVQMPDPLDIYADRAALGDLSDTVQAKDINENTLLMTEGVRQGLAAEFAPKESTRVPERIQRALKAAQSKTGSWKGVVLPLSLRWQVGDAMGNILNAWVRGDVPPSELVRYANMAYDMMRESQTMDGGQLARRRQLMFSNTLQQTVNNPFLNLLESYGLQSSGLKQSDLRSMMTNDMPDLFSVRLEGGLLNRTAAGRGYNRFRTGAFAFNEFQNRLAREAVAMQNLDVYLKKNGLTFDDVTVERVLADKNLEAAVVDAVQKANDVLGNFSELSPFERQTMRTIFPFWSWMKFINKAAMQLLIDQPDRLVFMAHLGGLSLEEDAEGLWDFLKGKPIVGGAYTDLGFTNPYADAVPFMFTGNQNPLSAAIEESQSISPVLSYPLYAAGEIAYGLTGRQQPLLPTFSRPGYLEGRPGETTRTLGDTLGGLAYYGLKQFGGPARNIMELSPVDFRVPGTDVSFGYPGVPRFPQGSLRTTGQYGVRRLSPTAGRLSAVMRTLGMPAPIVSADVVSRSAYESQRTGRDALLRRLKQRRLAQR